MDFIVCGLFSVVCVVLRLIDSTFHRQAPRAIQICTILTSSWLLGAIVVRFHLLLNEAYANWQENKLQSNFQLLHEGDQRFFLFGCVLFFFASIAILLNQYPTTRTLVDGVFREKELKDENQRLREQVKKMESAIEEERELCIEWYMEHQKVLHEHWNGSTPDTVKQHLVAFERQIQRPGTPK